MESQRASNPAVNKEIIVSAIFFVNVGLDKILLDKILPNHNFTLHFTAGSIRLRMPCAVKLHAFELGRCQTNAYVVEVPANAGENTISACWVVDPGESPEPLLNFLRDRGLKPEAILLTHAHADHIAGVDQVRAMFPKIPVLAHALEHEWFQDPQLNLSLFIGEPVSVSTPTGTLAHAQKLSLGGIQFQVLETPGHSPGSVTLHCPSEKFAIVGDTLFQNSIGRSDFPGSDSDVLMHSINQVLMTLPGDTAIYPGHGPSTTIDKERRSNPFLRK
jgi:glyoxylase-like metal-dependent hydrolase (beta-lactamase superfamily II)